MKVLLFALLSLYLALGFTTFLAVNWWDTVERTKRRIYWYPGFGFGGVLIMLVWPLFAVALYRIYRDPSRTRHRH